MTGAQIGLAVVIGVISGNYIWRPVFEGQGKIPKNKEVKETQKEEE